MDNQRLGASRNHARGPISAIGPWCGARAALMGSYMVRLEDIQEVAAPVLIHRLITTFAAQAEAIDAKQIVRRLIKETESTT